MNQIYKSALQEFLFYGGLQVFSLKEKNELSLYFAAFGLAIKGIVK
jgi:hypothetical protein